MGVTLPCLTGLHGKLGTVVAEYVGGHLRYVDLGRCGQLRMWLIDYEINRRKWLNLQSSLHARAPDNPLADG